MGKQSASVLEDIIDGIMPHPAAVFKYGDSGEVARKLKNVMLKLKQIAKQDLSEGGDTRSAVALRNYEDHWQEMVPKSGKGRFVLHAHWRGLSKNELGLSHEELLKTDHSVHCDLRLEIDNQRLWGFTVFEGPTKEVRDKGQGFERLTYLPATDSLQGTWKLEQPHAWLTIAHDKPYISEPGGVGATSGKYAKFFVLDTGEYDFSYARLHGREFFLHGSKLKGRFLIQFAPVSDSGRAWIINKPESQEPYTKTHTVESVLSELKRKGQDFLVWCSTPGSSPQILNVDSPLSKEYHAEIIKTDFKEHKVCGVISEPDSIDAQDDRLSAEEIKQMAEDFKRYVQEFRDRHTKLKVKVDLLKSRIAEKDFWYKGELIKAGSWWICVKVLDERIWSLIKRGIYKAFSIGGRGKRVPIRFGRFA
ncbi:Putative phage serine protease XkdF [uncultured archaeon]|nr:Putative phage serine protease XkdF [uncultured archaeon]